MKLKKTVLCAIGTRPELIKMAPVIRAIQEQAQLRCRVMVTAQHRELLDQMLKYFQIHVDHDLDAMRTNQTLSDLTGRLLTGIDRVIEKEGPDLVLAQGDTTTVLATALASFYRRVPFGHVEAGLRTGNLGAPFPEEANRVLAGKLAQLHFAPTAGACNNLLREGIPQKTIHRTGNTVIDALYWAVEHCEEIGIPLGSGRRLILVTAHRRDNFGEPIRHICQAISELVNKYPDVDILWPVHPNPAIKSIVHELLTDRPNIHLCQPLSYGSLVNALNRCYFVLTDSGGLQEEAPALSKPVLVMRSESERPEAIEAGVARLVGTEPGTILEEASRLLDDGSWYQQMSKGGSPYGDGKAAGRIAQIVADFLLGGASNEDSRVIPLQKGPLKPVA